jgi:tellurite resistance protein
MSFPPNKQQVELVDQILRCAYMAAFGDGYFSEEELDALIEIRGFVNRIYDAREAIEYYESTQDLEGAQKIYPPGSCDVAELNEWVFVGTVPPFLEELAEERRRAKDSEEIVAIGSREATKIKDRFWQKVAINVCAIVCRADGEVTDQEYAATVLMFDVDVGEAIEWFNTMLLPVVEGMDSSEDIDENDDEDIEDRFAGIGVDGKNAYAQVCICIFLVAFGDGEVSESTMALYEAATEAVAGVFCDIEDPEGLAWQSQALVAAKFSNLDASPTNSILEYAEEMADMITEPLLQTAAAFFGQTIAEQVGLESNQQSVLGKFMEVWGLTSEDLDLDT